MPHRQYMKAFFWCNLVFFLIAVGCFPFSWMAAIGASGRVTALDRVNAIDAAKAATVTPPGCVIPGVPAGTVMVSRNALGDWIAGPDRLAASMSNLLFSLTTGANVVLAVVTLRSSSHVMSDPANVALDAGAPRG